MKDPGPLFQDTIFRVLEAAPRGLTVERIRTQLAEAGATVRKDEIVRALAQMNQRQLVQFGAARRWHVRQHSARTDKSSSTVSSRPDEYFVAIPCQAMAGDGAVVGPEVQSGRIDPSIGLLKQLLPYYQEALRHGDSGQPQAFANQYGESFVLLEPDKPWWPNAEQGRTLVVPLLRLPQEIRSRLAKQHSRHLLLGYPLHVVAPRNDETDVFIRPVSVFRCRYEQTDTHIRIKVPVARPTIVRDWLRDQTRYGGWRASRLLSWLLIEDETAGLDTEDEADAPDFLEIPTFAARLESAAGKAQHERFLPDAVASRVPRRCATGFYNGLALFPEVVGNYVRSAIKDYDRLCQEPRERLEGSAIGALFGAPTPASAAPTILHPFPLGEAQLLATRAALSRPLTVITGPPGTGKSQVIAAIMLSAAASGRSVLLAARQHRAIDAVQERLESLTEDRVLLVRANESEGFARFTFADGLRALQARAGDQDAVRRFDRRLIEVAQTDTKRWDLLEKWRRLAAMGEKEGRVLAELDNMAADRAKLSGTAASPETAPTPLHFFLQLLRAVARVLRFSVRPRMLLGADFRHAHFDREETRLKATLREVEDRIRALRDELEGQVESPVSLGAKVQVLGAEIMEPLLDRLDAVTQDDRQALTVIAGDAGIMGRQGVDATAYRLVLKYMPLWAVTTLAAGSRIPLEAGLFDYVVFDEAGVTDIASALPLLFRAKAAVIVGDPMQLGMISNLDPREEGLMLSRHDLLRPGIGRFAQGQTDIFQLAASAIQGAPFLLNEHYRCHPEIAAYFNEAFYGRRLTALTDTSQLHVPRGFKPGLHWTDVQGSVSTGRDIGMEGSAYSDAEAEAVVEMLKALVVLGFEGTVGVVTFFAPQARRINERAVREIGADKLNRLNVKVFTANKFQGDERDVMLLSLCLSPDMPTGARQFLTREKRLMNVAISRARAVCHVFGNKTFAASCGIPHIETLVRRVNVGPVPPGDKFDDRFDSPWEKRLYEELVDRGINPIPQHPVGGRFLDLAVMDETRRPPVLLDIEVDGVAFHTDDDGNRLQTDLWRDHQLRGLGWKILRFWVYELRDNMEGCLERVDEAIGG